MGKMNYKFVLLMILVALGPLGHLVTKGWSMDKKGYENVSVDRFIKMMDHKEPEEGLKRFRDSVLTLLSLHSPFHDHRRGEPRET